MCKSISNILRQCNKVLYYFTTKYTRVFQILKHDAFFVSTVSISLGYCSQHEHAWDSGNEYKYLIQSETLTTLDRINKLQTSGIAMEGILIVQAQTPNTLQVRVSKLQYRHVNEQRSHYDKTNNQNKDYNNVPMSGKPFEITMKHGVIRDMKVENNVPVWEVNMLKGIMSQLQVDTQGENRKPSKNDQIPDDEEKPFASYKVVEDSVGGNCEVYYDIVPLSEEVIVNRPELVPFPHFDQENDKSKNKSNFIQINKIKDYEKCHQRRTYHYNQVNVPSWPNSFPQPNRLNDQLVSVS